MTLRESIRLRLVGAGTDPWGDRVLEMNAATVHENLPSPAEAVGGLPFIIIKLGPQLPGEQWSGQALVDTVEVWPYADDETFQTLDVLCGLVILRLDHQTIVDDDGKSYAMLYQGSPLQDAAVHMWDANTRPLRFDASSTAWPGVTDGAEHWLAKSLRVWTETTWPPAGTPIAPQVQTHPETWTPSDAAPGVYWRTTDLPRVREGAQHLPWMSIYNATVVGHVLAPSYGVRQEWIERLARHLEHATIHAADGVHGWLQWHHTTRADPNADPNDGQLTVEVQYAEANDAYTSAVGDLVAIARATGRDGTLVGVSPEPPYP